MARSGAGALPDLEQRRQRHHVARCRADLELANVVRPWRGNGAFSLDIDRIGPAELVEVVDVERAEIDLQRVEHLGHGNAELQRLGTVDCRRTAAAR